jgi:dihydrofolate reductase
VPAGGVYTFVRSPREAAEVAIGLAGGKDVDLFSASIGGQLLRAGLVDEVRIHLAPVLLGAGTRLLDDDDGHIRLQPTRITESSKATHLRYRVHGRGDGLTCPLGRSCLCRAETRTPTLSWCSQ